MSFPGEKKRESKRKWQKEKKEFHSSTLCLVPLFELEREKVAHFLAGDKKKRKE